MKNKAATDIWKANIKSQHQKTKTHQENKEAHYVVKTGQLTVRTANPLKNHLILTLEGGGLASRKEASGTLL